jgi:hypothetical protein
MTIFSMFVPPGFGRRRVIDLDRIGCVEPDPHLGARASLRHERDVVAADVSLDRVVALAVGGHARRVVDVALVAARQLGGAAGLDGLDRLGVHHQHRGRDHVVLAAAALRR